MERTANLPNLRSNYLWTNIWHNKGGHVFVLALPDTKHSRTDLLFSLPFEKLPPSLYYIQQFHYNSCNIHSLQLVVMDRARVPSPMPNC